MGYHDTSWTVSSWTDTSWTAKIRRVQPVLREPGTDGPGSDGPVCVWVCVCVSDARETRVVLPHYRHFLARQPRVSDVCLHRVGRKMENKTYLVRLLVTIVYATWQSDPIRKIYNE